MVRREVWFCATLLIVGTLDWLTTLVGVAFFGAHETNPLIAGLTRSNMLLFSVVKLVAITLTGLLLYKAETTAKIVSHISPFTKNFVHLGYAICLFTLSVIVLNNFSAIVGTT